MIAQAAQARERESHIPHFVHGAGHREAAFAQVARATDQVAVTTAAVATPATPIATGRSFLKSVVRMARMARATRSLTGSAIAIGSPVISKAQSGKIRRMSTSECGGKPSVGDSRSGLMPRCASEGIRYAWRRQQEGESKGISVQFCGSHEIQVKLRWDY